MKIKDIKKATINPREMTSEAKAGLKASMEKFGDISGLIWNKRTKELVGGNHRWTELTKLHEKKSLEFKKIEETDLYLIYSYGDFTGYTLRVVDWDEKKATAANLSANNPNITGYFTKQVDDLLDNISSLDFFSDLKLSDLRIELPEFSPQKEKDVEDKMFDDVEKETEDDEIEIDVSDEEFDFSTGFSDEEADIPDEKPIEESKRVEINLVLDALEDNINIQQIHSELTEFIAKKYKISFLNILAID